MKSGYMDMNSERNFSHCMTNLSSQPKSHAINPLTTLDLKPIMPYSHTMFRLMMCHYLPYLKGIPYYDQVISYCL